MVFSDHLLVQKLCLLSYTMWAPAAYCSCLQLAANHMKLKIEILQLEKETADITHPFYLGKCSCTLEKTRVLNDFISSLMFLLST
uniref:Secreted protein n=1 Tax=Amazona collaria TaxID=241587 RepID=A0A8B9FAT8_9PSIT